ncbi:MAG TPA: rhodanese-like domain-containing protein [Bacteroidales bacterium]|nr:rhodanese-like domain-containing protein [Bacteroidales bacterium]HOK74170.1 rhodanese-like domain-containing protein [Bacteroidales bacterium]HOM39487.1 rhodanese-like domain-containing protein [Bacteroidales bacterium]HOU31155.1 rhodanese-like domain-containing protein [Bacteroidales bacterium]HPP91869.1 rhodanese-like domain-containing protein [Bacteroidales bacterium]
MIKNDSLKGFFAHNVLNYTPAECYRMCKEGATIVDVREGYMTSFKMFDVDNIIYIPFSRFTELYNSLPCDVTLIFADSAGLKSRECVLYMVKNGYTNVANMAGGMVEWERDGLPVKVDKNFRLSGSCMCQIKAREKGK